MSKRRSRSYAAVTAHQGGPHELGQSFLVDEATIDAITRLTESAPDPIVELCPGSGAVTVPLSESGRPITAVELDPRHAGGLEQRTPDNVRVVREDVLRFRFPRQPHTLVGNLPFHLTTPVLRRILAAEHWRTAEQWARLWRLCSEPARKPQAPGWNLLSGADVARRGGVLPPRRHRLRAGMSGTAFDRPTVMLVTFPHGHSR